MNEEMNAKQTIFDAISNIMSECNVKKDLIDAGNAGKYNAFTIDSVLDNIRPLLAKHKLIMSIKHDLIESQYVDFETKFDAQEHYYFTYQLKDGVSTETIGYKILLKSGVLEKLKLKA